MLALHVTGWLAILAGAGAAAYGATGNTPWMLGAGLSAVASGVLYIALERGLDMLADIRDRLTPARAAPDAPQAPTARQAA